MAYQVFHSPFFINDRGEHPDPYTEISVEDVESGKWKVNPLLVDSAAANHKVNLQQYVLHYCRALESTGKYQLMIWPFHAMLGGVGHALVALIEEAVFYHTIARQHQARFLVKGDNPLTENYSVLGPEVQTDEQGNEIAHENEKLIELLLSYDRVFIAGQAKSHCVAWTVQDLLAEIRKRDDSLAQKIYLLEDCTSPVVVPGGQDFTEKADEAFEKFKAAGMHLVKSTNPLSSWPGMPRGE
jgi:nicotinamidase-related amidase